MNGLLFTDTPPSSFLSEASPPEGKPGFLVGFIDGRRALQWSGHPMEERKKMAVDLIVKYFVLRARNPLTTSTRTGRLIRGAAAAMVRPWDPQCLPPSAQLCVPASGGFTGREQKHLRFGRVTSKAQFAPVSGLRLRSWPLLSKVEGKR